MTETDLLVRLGALMGQATLLAVPSVALVEAIRKRIPFDGWKVLAVSAVACLLLTGLLLSPRTVATALDAGTVALLAWVVSVGGDSWLAKLATKSRTITVVDDSTFRPTEPPTRPDRPTTLIPPKGP